MFAIMAVVCIEGISMDLIADKLSDAHRAQTASE